MLEEFRSIEAQENAHQFLGSPVRASQSSLHLRLSVARLSALFCHCLFAIGFDRSIFLWNGALFDQVDSWKTMLASPSKARVISPRPLTKTEECIRV